MESAAPKNNMKRFTALSLILLPFLLIVLGTPIVKAQFERFFRVQILDTSSSALTVGGGIVAGTGAVQIVDAAGNLTAAAGAVQIGGNAPGSTLQFGTTNSQAVQILVNNTSALTLSTSRDVSAPGNGRFTAGVNAGGGIGNHAFTAQDSGSLMRYYKLGRYDSGTAGGGGNAGNPGATETTILMDTDNVLKANVGGTGWQTFQFVGGSGARTWMQWVPVADQMRLPTSSPASFSTRNDHSIVAFSDAVLDTVLLEGTLPGDWDGSTLYLQIFWMSTATSGTVVWDGSFERLADSAQDLDVDGFDSAVTSDVAVATSSTSGVGKTSRITFSSGFRDSIAAGETFRIKLRRNGTNGSDTLTVDAQVISVQLTK